MKKIVNLIQIVLFCAFIYCIFIANLITPSKNFSERENRYLAQAPSFSLKALESGDFTSDFESYITDQFILRDSWTSLKARSEIISGKQENNNVYLCDDETLITRFEPPNESRFNSNISYINDFADSVDIPVYFELIPGPSAVWADKLPNNAPNADQFAYIDRAYAETNTKNVDTASILSSHKDEYIYYRTDHHWTSLGAYYGYTALMETMEKSASPITDYNRKIVSDNFYGTTYSSSGMSWISPDEIEIFVDEPDGLEILNYNSGNPETGVLYKYEQLDKKDKYSMFLGGNTSLLQIKTGIKDASKLLIIRDSYADSRIPFLLEHFSEIHVIDLRYYKLSIADYISSNDIDEVLVSYSVSNFCEDTNLFALTR